MSLREAPRPLDASEQLRGTDFKPPKLKGLFERIYADAVRVNEENILSAIERNPEAKLLDLGCDDGTWTKKLGAAAGTQRLYGVEIVEERLSRARENGVDAIHGDLAQPLALSDASVDVIHANQVIEHVPDLDLFASEMFRVLRPGGYVVVSTENGSSWHNIAAAVLGWQIFSLTNLSSTRLGIGNPFAIQRGNVLGHASWTHKTIFNYRGLEEFLLAHGFEKPTILGAGYHPFPAAWGRWDVRHSHFITVKARKPA